MGFGSRARMAREQAAEAAERERESAVVAAGARGLLHRGSVTPPFGWVRPPGARAPGAEGAAAVAPLPAGGEQAVGPRSGVGGASRLIDALVALGRMASGALRTAPESAARRAVVEEAAAAYEGGRVGVELPADPPAVRADRA